MNIAKILATTLISLLLFYFLYHVFVGNRGLIAMWSIENTLIEKRKELETLQKEKTILENKVQGLQARYKYDLDFIDELARKQLGLAGIKEKVVLLKKEDIEDKKG